MKRLLALFAILSFLFFHTTAHAVTVYYQPTPYPLKKYDDTAMPQNLDIVHLWDGWLPSEFYGQQFIRDDKLQLGGWGDEYRIFMKFDIAGLPYSPDQMVLYLKSYDRGDSSTTTPFALCKVGSSWDLSLTWNTQPSFPTCWGWYSAPTPGNWWGIILTSLYNDWKNGAVANNGVMMFPQNKNNNFNMFRSSRYTSSYRPILRFDFTPTLQLKMPLPGGHKWLVTNEVGGYECLGQSPWPDIYHQDSTGNYFAVDFSWRNILDGGSTVYTESSDIPILAAAGGKIVDIRSSNPNHPNGYYIVVDHDSDGNISTGFTTRYLHLKYPPARSGGTPLQLGDSVTQGEEIGVMGTTGEDAQGNPTSTGIHLHFGVRYQNSGLSTVPELAKVVMDGDILKGYQTKCSEDADGTPLDWIRYYKSENTVY